MFWKNRTKSEKQTAPPPSGAPGKRAYAIGDVHGRADLLLQLLKKIDRHASDTPADKTHVIFLGDLIDRGPDSRGVVETLMHYSKARPNCHFVKGNHEESLVRGLSGEPDLLSAWLHHGGYATAESYGVDPGALMNQPAHILEHMLISAIPRHHVAFMGDFLESIEFGDYLFVHAGIRPGVPIEKQSSKDFRWIRGEFLNSDEDFGRVVVHGHTICEQIEHKHNRIGLDTGAYETGILSAVWIDGPSVGFLQATDKTA